VIRHAPEQYGETLSRDCSDAISGERKEAYGHLYAHWVEKGFHCAHAVFGHLRQTIPVNQELLDGASGFLGGTVFTGATCSALTAGVMGIYAKVKLAVAPQAFGLNPGMRNPEVELEFYFRARYGVKSSQICWSTFGSTTRVSPFSGSFSEYSTSLTVAHCGPSAPGSKT
jgi:hypothetical protein